MHTQTDHINAKNLLIKGRIMPLLQWDEQQYAAFKMRCGCNFMQNYMPQYPALVDELVESRLFWAWWCNQWLIRDEALLMQPGFINSTPEKRVSYYKWLHSPDNLLKIMVVDSVIFENTSITKTAHL